MTRSRARTIALSAVVLALALCVAAFAPWPVPAAAPAPSSRPDPRAAVDASPVVLPTSPTASVAPTAPVAPAVPDSGDPPEPADPTHAIPPAVDEVIPPIELAVPPLPQPVVRRARSADERADDAYHDAQIERDPMRARALLRQAIALDPLHGDARERLAEDLAHAGDIPGARRLIAAGLELDPDRTSLAKLDARILAAAGRVSDAVERLEEDPPRPEEDPEWHALLAALRQRAGRHREAIHGFRAALRVEPGRPVWWLGLALSFEATGDPRSALEAFEQARTAGPLDGASANFVVERIHVLRAAERGGEG